MKLKTLEEQFKSWENEELIEATTISARSFRQFELEAMKNELANRGINPESKNDFEEKGVARYIKIDPNENLTNEIVDKTNAGFWKRVVAYLIDMTPILAITFLFYYFFTDFQEVYAKYRENIHDVEMRKLYLFEYRNGIRHYSFLIWIVYSTILEASQLKGTVGKKLMGISVVDENGNGLSMKKSIIRNLSKIISYMILCIGFIMAAFTEQKQSLHDKIAKTYVVNN